MRHCLLLLITIFFSAAGVAQNLKYRQRTFDWPATQVQKIPVSEEFKNEDIVILDENLELFIQDGKMRTNWNNVYFKKHMRIKVLTKAGVQKISTINLPESMNPVADQIRLSYTKRNQIHRPKGDYDCMDYFAARIIKPDGSIIPALFNDSISTETEIYNLRPYTSYAFHFKIKNLEPGDELEINYGLREVETANIVYFHGVYPKQHCRVEIKYNGDKFKYYFIEHNGAQGTRSDINSKYNFSEMNRWEYSNLPAVMNENGSRPHEQLPHVSFYQHQLDFGIFNESRTILQTYLPYTWDFVNLYLVKYLPESKEDRLSRTDKTTLAVRDFVSPLIEDIKDSSSVVKMGRIHNHIARTFNYQRDDDFLQGGDFRLPRIDEFLKKNTIRQVSRIDLYDKIFARIDSDFYGSFLFDKRVNTINFDSYEPSVLSSYCHAVVNEGAIYYFMPKSHRFGYYMDELPFYFEDIKMILIPQTVPYMVYYDNVKKVSYVFHKTPYSTVANNSRNTTVMCAVSTDSMQVRFNATVKLSGQFSTMTRGSYLYDFVDTTATPQYAEKVYDVIPGATKGKIITLREDSVFPYKADFSTEFVSKKILTSSGEAFELDLKGFFNHIHDTKVVQQGRDLDYYPDFVHQDRYKYFLKFDSPVSITSPTDSSEINTEIGVYRYSVAQVQPDVIMLESAFVLKSDKVPVKDVWTVEKLYKEIARRNTDKLRIKKL
ncbi:MAG: hypothetical protein BWY67_00107 [Bacteroidetes bacterium ADurb.Bin397]|jgi:hypothetical protein|nr:MAG: hypothetical protein BWY67_00107 [Bacteroidetes bacterium ADurb.Bin397]